MSVVIKAVALATGARCPYAGQYLKSFDFEAYNGVGDGDFTRDLDKAMRFADYGAAFAFWKQSPKCKPIRSDGKPNRPLTALTCEIFDPEKPVEGSRGPALLPDNWERYHA